ncbi:MAG: hypothetical protein ACRCTF_05625 [Bacteroidales bacterium]
MKRIATLTLVILALLIAVQPQIVLHFCGDSFIALYLNQDPFEINPSCAITNHCEGSANDIHSKGCDKQRVSVIDVDSDEFLSSNHSFNDINIEVTILSLSLLSLFRLPLISQAEALYSEVPPYPNLQTTGREILLRHSILLI